MRFVRYQSMVPTERGSFPGIFGLANGLARGGRLDAADQAWWRAANDHLDRAYLDPGRVDATLFDRTVHPITACWFRADATLLLDRVAGYLDLLDRYGVPWQRLDSDDPGRILYQDEDQIVVIPYGRSPG